MEVYSSSEDEFYDSHWSSSTDTDNESDFYENEFSNDSSETENNEGRDEDRELSLVQYRGEVILTQPYQYEPFRQLEEPQNDPADQDAAAYDARLLTTNWCECGRCSIMSERAECICCRECPDVEGFVERNCVTQHGDFHDSCLSNPALRILYREFVAKPGRRPQEPTEGLIHKYMAYRSFMRWIYFRLPKGERYAIPSCVVLKIRETFPSDEYCGFKHYVARRHIVQ